MMQESTATIIKDNSLRKRKKLLIEIDNADFFYPPFSTVFQISQKSKDIMVTSFNFMLLFK